MEAERYEEQDIREPNQKAIILFDAGREDIVLHVKYEGAVQDFGWIIPVPGRPTVRSATMECFSELSRATRKPEASRGPAWPTRPGIFGGRGGRGGFGASGGNGGSLAAPPPVEVLETRTVGAYDITILSANDPGGLQQWLETNHYAFPQNKAAVVDFYVKQHWHFVAIKIHLGQTNVEPLNYDPTLPAPGRDRLQQLLSEGELHPLQITFDTDQCIFPLKISSANGHSSEVLIYVLSQEPFLEPAMFDQAVNRARSNNIAGIKIRQETVKGSHLLDGKFDPPRLPDLRPAAGFDLSSPVVLEPALEAFGPGLHACRHQLTNMSNRHWWLAKYTWTFKPEEMQDLIFEPAVPALVRKLTGSNGPAAARNLWSLGPKGRAALQAALEGANADAFYNAATAAASSRDPNLLHAAGSRLDDPDPSIRLGAALLIESSGTLGQIEDLAARLNDSDPRVRVEAVRIVGRLWGRSDAEQLHGLLQDPDAIVRQEAAYHLRSDRDGSVRYAPQLLATLHDADPGVQVSGLETTLHLKIPIPHEELRSFFSTPHVEIFELLEPSLRQESFTIDETEPLLRNPVQLARILGLDLLARNSDAHVTDLIISMLRDREWLVREEAYAVLQARTGRQDVPRNQPEKWEKWWAANKGNFGMAETP